MRSLAILLLAPLAPLASAQGAVHVVGNGGAYSDLQPAIDAAADGDVVLVRQGAYDRFTIAGKGVSVIADTDAEVLVAGEIVVRDVPAGSLAVLRGLATGERSGDGLRVRDCAGAVRVEECALAGQDGPGPTFDESTFFGAQVVDSDAVLFARCALRGGDGGGLGFYLQPTHGGAALRISAARVAVVDSTLVGGSGASSPDGESWDGGHGGDGVLAWDADLWVSGTTAYGGNGGDAYSDYELFLGKICGDSGDGGNGIRALWLKVPYGFASSTIVVRDFTAFPGVGGWAECGDNGLGGEAIAQEGHDLTQLPGAARGAWGSSPARSGANARVYVRGEPGDVAIVAFGAPAPYLALPGHPLPLATAPQATIVLGALPPSGLAIQPIPVPPMPAGFGGLTLGLQGVIVPASGAGFEIAPFGTITLLDPAF